MTAAQVTKGVATGIAATIGDLGRSLVNETSYGRKFQSMTNIADTAWNCLFVPS